MHNMLGDGNIFKGLRAHLLVATASIVLLPNVTIAKSLVTKKHRTTAKVRVESRGLKPSSALNDPIYRKALEDAQSDADAKSETIRDLSTKIRELTNRLPPVEKPPIDDNQRARMGLLRYIMIDPSNWDVRKTANAHAGLYSRIILYSANEKTNSDKLIRRDYRSEQPGFLAKLFSSPSRSANVHADISMHNPELSMTQSLVSIQFDNTQKIGDAWKTDYVASGFSTPLFLIQPDTNFQIKLVSDTTFKGGVHGAGRVITAVVKTLQATSPQSALLTPLNSQSYKDAAASLDGTISGLFSNAVNESLTIGRAAANWEKDSSIQLIACAPDVAAHDPEGTEPGWGNLDDAKINIDGQPVNTCSQRSGFRNHYDRLVGIWKMTLTCPRPSVFDQRDICTGFDAVGVPIDISQSPNLSKIPLINTLRSGTSSPSLTDQNFKNLTKLDEIQYRVGTETGNRYDIMLHFNLNGTEKSSEIVEWSKQRDWYSTFIKLGPPAATRTNTDYTSFCSGSIHDLQGVGFNEFDAALATRALIEQAPNVSDYYEGFHSLSKGGGCKRLINSANVAFELK